MQGENQPESITGPVPGLRATFTTRRTLALPVAIGRKVDMPSTALLTRNSGGSHG